MKDILQDIIARKRTDVEMFKQFLPADKLYGLVAQKMDEDHNQVVGGSMKTALVQSQSGIIAEFKRRSPSKGWIHEDAKADIVPLAYQQGGAAALSILTDTPYFGGYDEFIQEARLSGVNIPVLYKNFVIDEYQLFQARYSGASAVLLIAAALTQQECKRLLTLAHNLGMEVLLEMHSEPELEYAALEPDMYGINNRNLGSFVTSVDNSFRLVEQLPEDGCKVSESGLSNAVLVSQLRSVGFNGFLIGENFMKTEAPGEALADFIRGMACIDEV